MILACAHGNVSKAIRLHALPHCLSDKLDDFGVQRDVVFVFHGRIIH